MESTTYLTAAEVAPLLRTTTFNVLKLCRENKIPASKPAGRWLISETDLAAYLDASRNGYPHEEAS